MNNDDLKIGPCRVEFGGIEIGTSGDGSKINVNMDTVDVKKTNEQVKRIVTGVHLTVKIPADSINQFGIQKIVSHDSAAKKLRLLPFNGETTYEFPCATLRTKSLAELNRDRQLIFDSYPDKDGFFLKKNDRVGAVKSEEVKR